MVEESQGEGKERRRNYRERGRRGGGITGRGGGIMGRRWRSKRTR